jgi:hypothetical protein
MGQSGNSQAASRRRTARPISSTNSPGSFIQPPRCPMSRCHHGRRNLANLRRAHPHLTVSHLADTALVKKPECLASLEQASLIQLWDGWLANDWFKKDLNSCNKTQKGCYREKCARDATAAEASEPG